MPVTQIEELRARRKGLLDEMREIQSGAEAADRDLTAEETQEFERREADFDAITKRIERDEKLAGLAPIERDNPVNPATEEVEARGISADPVENAEIEKRAFEKILRSKGDQSGLAKEERAALKVGADAQGGYTVPKAFERTLVESAREFGVIAGLATHITTGDNGDLSVPTVASNASATWKAEEGSIDESEGVFGTITLKAYKAAVIAKVSDELLSDSAFDILGWLAKDQGEAIGTLTGAAYATGAANSTTTPRGLITAATAVNSGAASTMAVGNLFDLYHAVSGPYRADGVWLMNDAIVKVIRSYTEAVNGQYLWQPGLQAGTPDTLLGRPVYTESSMASAVGANALVMAFGDVRRGYIIRDVEGIGLKILNELYAATGQVGFRATLRTDGALRDSKAVRVLKIAA